MAFAITVIQTICISALGFLLPSLPDIPHARRRAFIIYIILVSIAETIYSQFDDGTLGTLRYLALMLLIIAYFSIHKITSAIIALLNYGICVALDYLLLIICYYFFGISELELAQSTTYLIPFYTIYILYVTLCGLLMGKLYVWWLKKNIHIPPYIILSILLFLILYSTFLIFNFSFERKQGYPQNIVLANFIFFCILIIIATVFVIVFVRLTKENYDLKEKNLYYESFQKYTRQLEEQYLKMSGFKHNYMNLLLTMDLYIKNKEWDSLESYFQQHILPTKQQFEVSEQYIRDLQNIKDTGLKSICYNKLVRAGESGIQTYLEVKNPTLFEDSYISDLTQIIGIYLDNAIEHLLTLSDVTSKILEMSILQKDDEISVIIQNTCPELSLDIQKLGTLGYSTKGQYHGMGLYLASNLLKEHPNITHTTQYKNKIFIQIINIRKYGV